MQFKIETHNGYIHSDVGLWCKITFQGGNAEMDVFMKSDEGKGSGLIAKSNDDYDDACVYYASAMNDRGCKKKDIPND